MKAWIVSVLLSCAAAVSADERAVLLAIGAPERRNTQVPLVLDAVTDGARGDVLTPAELAPRLDGVRLLFVGESHTDMEFHLVQLRVLQELQRRGRRVLVGLEMFPVSAQPALDLWNAGAGLSEREFVSASRWYTHWGYHWNYYREIFLFAREGRMPLFGINVPRPLVEAVRRGGLEGLTAEQKALLPARVDTDSAEHRTLLRSLFGSSGGPHGNMPEAAFEGLYRAQCTWDAAMGWNAVQALRRHGPQDAIMVVLVGSGHAVYGLGAERQARLWFDGRTASLVPVPVSDDDEPGVVERVQGSYADFVWGLPPARDPLYPSVGLSLPETRSGANLKVLMVVPDSPAAGAGFQPGDEIVSADGVAISEKGAHSQLIADKRWGDRVVYRVLRAGREMTLTACLRRPSPKRRAPLAPRAGGGL